MFLAGILRENQHEGTNVYVAYRFPPHSLLTLSLVNLNVVLLRSGGRNVILLYFLVQKHHCYDEGLEKVLHYRVRDLVWEVLPLTCCQSYVRKAVVIKTTAV